MSDNRGGGWATHQVAAPEADAAITVSLSQDSTLGERSPVVMMLTGDGAKGTKSSSWVDFPPMLSRLGIRSYMIDFEGLGYSDGDRSTLTLSRASENVRRAYAFLRNELIGGDVKVGSIASSFGASALLATPEVANHMVGIALKSPAPFLAEAYLNDIGIEEFRKWVTEGYSSANGYSVDVLEDALNHNVFLKAKEIVVPCVITHGTSDEMVPYVQSELLVASLKGSARLDPIEDGDHGYSKEGQKDYMMNTFVQFLSGVLT